MRFVLAILAALSIASPALAEEYEKGPNGGLMLDVAGIDAELMTSGNTVTFNIFVPNTPEPVSTKSFTAAALIVNPRDASPCASGREFAEGRRENLDSSGRDDHIDHQDRRGEIGTGKIQKVGGT